MSAFMNLLAEVSEWKLALALIVCIVIICLLVLGIM